MVIKVKEISISRGRKWAWNYGNAVGYNVSITIEGTTVKDTVEDMVKTAILEIVPMESAEQSRCKDIVDIVQLQEGIEFKEGVEKVETSVRQDPRSSTGQGIPGNAPQPDSKTTASGHPVEKIVVTEEKTIITEAVLMTPDEVTMLVKTDLAMLVTKKGFQKWIPFSMMPDISKDDYEAGEYIEKITIKEDKSKWFNEIKGWDKLEVRKS